MGKYVFSGNGRAIGKYKITNAFLEELVKTGFVEQFSSKRIMQSEEYKKFLANNPESSPVDYFVGHTMGFGTRYHVQPFPPHQDKDAQNTVDLAVIAIDNALKDANIHPEKVGGWVLSTASPPEQAPGIAGTVKCYFVNENNQTQVRTITAGCPGFHESLRTAIDMLECDKSLDHIAVCHTETMSKFLRNRRDLISFATFGDAAAAVILSRNGKENSGLNLTHDFQDPKMIGYLGVSDIGDLYIDGIVVKKRAIENMFKAGKRLLQEQGLRPSDIDLLMPHQTGNKIVLDLAERLGIPEEKTFTKVQYNYGNLSGASVPFGISLLKEQGKLYPGMKILSTSVGTGGEYGAFLYVVPSNKHKSEVSYSSKEDLLGKTVLLTGATSSIGSKIAKKLASKGARLILHYNANEQLMQSLKEDLKGSDFKIYKANFLDKNAVEEMTSSIKNENSSIDYIIHTTGIPGSVDKASSVTSSERDNVMRINYHSPADITTKLKDKLSKDGAVLYIGSIAEDHQFEGSAAYVSSKRALHGFAASMSNELDRMDVRTIYYMIGLTNGGMIKTLSHKQIASVLSLMKQDLPLEPDVVAGKIVNSLYKPKILDTYDKQEARMIVRRDGYNI